MDKEKWMDLALGEALKAQEKGEVPVGAVLVDSNENLVAQAHNDKESSFDPTGHAEIIVLKKASKSLKTWRLKDLTLFVTLEPCMMCTGALVHARIKSIVFGAKDPKAGFVTSTAKGFDDFPLNHRPKWENGILEEKCSTLLKNFFKLRRNEHKK
jgi:tRNA(adenine34) deaminase